MQPSVSPQFGSRLTRRQAATLVRSPSEAWTGLGAADGLAVEHPDRGAVLFREVTNAEPRPPFGANTSATSPCRGWTAAHRVLSH